MGKKESAHIVHYYCKQLIKHSEKMTKGFGEGAIHDFRVDVKRLRAFFRMMRLRAMEPGQLKYSRQFKKMYSTTGKIRDRQLSIRKIRGTNKNQHNNKINDLKKEIKELTDGKEHLLSKKDFKEMEENMIKHLPAVAGVALIKDFIQQKLDQIFRIIEKGNYTGEALHSIRKNFKDIIYITAISGEDLKIKTRVSPWSDPEMKDAKDFADALGSFNDTSVALSFFAPAEIKKKDPDQREHLQTIRRQWLAEKRKLKKDIIQRIAQIKIIIGGKGKNN